MAKRYYNSEKNVYYTEGTSITWQVNPYTVTSGKPTAAQLAEWGFTEVVEPVYEPTPIPIEQQYKDLVVSKIRLQYSSDDELAILRQKETKPSEFATYNSYCEQCKSEAKEELNYNESEEG